MTGTIPLLALALLATGIEEKGPPMQQLTPNTFARAGGSEGPAARIEEIAWIAGNWVTDALGGQAEEIWSKPHGGSMMGMFRLAKDDKIVFYEILTIVEENGSLVCRLKHFNPDLTGWEEKDESVTFPLVRMRTGEVNFDGMTFRKVDDGLHVFVASRQKDGTSSELAFRYRPRSGH